MKHQHTKKETEIKILVCSSITKDKQLNVYLLFYHRFLQLVPHVFKTQAVCSSIDNLLILLFI